MVPGGSSLLSCPSTRATPKPPLALQEHCFQPLLCRTVFQFSQLSCCLLPTYGSLIFEGVFGNLRATFSYKLGGSPQSSRRRCCTAVNGDNSACVSPLASTTL